ncbi:MAG: molybdopterin-dependent oxidoreductase [Selenomonas sp.]|uniref:molybdopterin-dependent oxidoreductase n=1 Tax=Selenomonas sp. TaxID=2053611 RepID=UPI0025E91C65|nr:molybdopterin-dependent oxidoreductase [Selenomonas sp.]MCR5756708.1 molybdopterin-dependent oxidoreductase [Selenomonas sp.]
MFLQENYQVTRHICPRNCYDSCPMLAFTRGGKIEYITGDKTSGTSERLCSKREDILAAVYHPQRLLYPQRQIIRGSGNWQRISWEEAIDTIAHKILELKKRYHSTLPLCLNKYSGNFGLLHYAVEGMFNSLGPTTQTTGTPCFSSGLDAQLLDFGRNVTTDVRQLLNARLIILWGVNPAWTSVHTMSMIYAARERGAKVVVIDPVYTETARKADYYMELRPGSDAALAILLLQKLAAKGRLTYNSTKTSGADTLIAAVQKAPTDKLLSAIGQQDSALTFLTDLIAQNSPMHIWCGYGLQRHVQGGLTIRLIDALAQLTGNIGIPGGGVNFADKGMNIFPYKIMQKRSDTRFVNINNFAYSLQQLTGIPVRFLWIACRNPLRQDAGLADLQEIWSQLELVVVADKVMTHSAQMADILLPVTTEFEELDVYGGYFFHHVGLNEPAIPPRGEAKTDLEIARLLTRRLNELAPGSSSFPSQHRDEDFLAAEFTPAVCKKLHIQKWQDLYHGPVLYHQQTIPWAKGKFSTSDGKFHCCSLPDDITHLFPSQEFPFHLITPHSQNHINSQSAVTHHLLPEYPIIHIHRQTGEKLHLKDKHPAILWNALAEIPVNVHFRDDLSPDILLSMQGDSQKGGLNLLNAGHPTDLGMNATAAPGIAFYDVFVNIRPQ